VPEPLGSAHRLSAPYQALHTSDGYMNLGAANQRTWEAFCRAVGLEDLLTDERFTTNTDRKAREDELASLLEETLRAQPTAYWVNLLEEAGVPAGPIYNLDQVYNDPHVRARNMVVELDDPHLGTIKHIGVPVKLSDTPGTIRHRAPDLGEHSREVLLEAGYTPAEVASLVEHGVIRVPAEQAV
jgi:crotonobetainyl-CoA:carnitine CoA-transferase CaiB-like acyl-CoA transferase